MADLRWWVVVPMKNTRRAKSRLGGDPDGRRDLAVAMARDTLRAAAKAVGVEGVVLVCDEAGDAAELGMPGVRAEVRAGCALNDAVRAGAAAVLAEDPNRSVAALPADLPYLRSDELTLALGRAAREAFAVVADRGGLGTALIAARRGGDLEPAFGPDSLRRHRALGAREIAVPAWSGLRRDVDHAEDLTSVQGIGPHTNAALRGRALATVDEGIVRELDGVTHA